MRIRSSKAGFSLLEIVVAAGLLGLGLLSFVRVFPFGLKVSQRVEDVTRASILAQTMFEGLKADSRDFPIIPGDPITLVPLPGDGFDNDGDWGLAYRTTPSVVDLNNNGRPDSDFDGYGEATKFQGNGVDDDGDGVIDDTGDGMRAAAGGVQKSQAHPISYMVSTFIQPDGNFTYDPEPYVDEEWANGGDDDRDGLIDEDSALSTSQQTPLFAAVRASGFNLSKYVGYDTGRRPLAAGDGLDNDGNGELDQKKYNDPDDANDEYVFDEVHDKGIRRANGVDDNNDGVIDEFIDDRVFGRGLFNLSDTELARFPWSPMRFPAPNERYAWQIYTGPVSDTDVPPELATVFRGRYVTGNLGNGVDEDGDGAIDEELRDGVDNDGDGRIDCADVTCARNLDCVADQEDLEQVELSCGDTLVPLDPPVLGNLDDQRTVYGSNPGEPGEPPHEFWGGGELVIVGAEADGQITLTFDSAGLACPGTDADQNVSCIDPVRVEPGSDYVFDTAALPLWLEPLDLGWAGLAARLDCT